MNNQELKSNQQQLVPSVQNQKLSNPLGIKIIALGCFIWPFIALLLFAISFLMDIHSISELKIFILSGIFWGYSIGLFFYLGLLIVMSVISVILGIILLKRNKFAYALILFFSFFIITFELTVVFVNKEFKLDIFSLTSLWCLFVISILVKYRKIF